MKGDWIIMFKYLNKKPLLNRLLIAETGMKMVGVWKQKPERVT